MAAMQALLLMILLPLAVSAQSGSLLEPALTSLEETLRLTEEWLQWQASEEARQESSELIVLPKRERSSQRSSSAATDSGSLVVTIDGSTTTLSDVPRSAWFAPYVRSAADRGVISGYRDAAGKPTGMFGPGDNVTVAELAKMAVLAAAINPISCNAPSKNPATDGAWFAQVFSCAEQRGWVLYGDGSVDPFRPALRGEVVVTLLQAMNAAVTPLTSDIGPFTDVTPGTQYAAAIARAKRDGIVSGYTDQSGSPTGAFGPSDPVTRAEAAKMTMLSAQTYKK